MLQVVQSVSRDLIGPNGICALSRSNQFSGTKICSFGSGLLAECGGHPLLSVILKNTAAAQEESHGDGAVSATFFACSLIHMLNKQGPLSSASRSLTASVFQRCLEWCIEQLTPDRDETFRAHVLEKLPLSLGNVTSMTALIRGMFSTKAFAAPDSCAVDMFAAQLVRTFTLTQDWCADEDTNVNDLRNSLNYFESPQFLEDSTVRILKVLGSPPEMSTCFEGIIIDEQSCVCHLDDQQFTEFCHGGRILLFSESNELVVDRRVKIDASAACAEMRPSLKSFSLPSEYLGEDVLSAIVSACKQLDVRVVISQCALCGSLQEILLRAGVLSIGRVSVGHIAALTRLTGGNPVLLPSQLVSDAGERNSNALSETSSFLSSMWSGSLGICGNITSIKLGSQRYALIRPPSEEDVIRLFAADSTKQRSALLSPQSVVTLVLSSPVQIELKQLSVAVRLARQVRPRAFFVNFMKSRFMKGFPQRWTTDSFPNFKAQVLDSLYEKGNFAAGGGNAEVLMAEYIRDKAKAIRAVNEREHRSCTYSGHISFKRSLSTEAKVEQQAVEIFSLALEDLTSLLVPVEAREDFLKIIGLANDCLNLTVRTTQSDTGRILLCAKHTQEVLHGLKKEGSSASTGMLDFLPSKCEGLRKAVETACAIITSDFL